MATYTGNTTTLVLSDAGGISPLVSINGFEWSRPALNKSSLSTRYFEAYIPGDLWDAGEISATIQLDPDGILAYGDTVAGDPPWKESPAQEFTASQTMTITFPNLATTPATLVGTVMASGVTMQELISNEILLGDITLRFDGITKPYFTASA